MLILFKLLFQELLVLQEKNKVLKQRIRCLETEKEFYLTSVLNHPVISKVITEFFSTLTNGSHDSKQEVVYQQN